MGQVLFNAMQSAALLAPPAIAFSLLFGILRFPNFSVGATITIGAFIAYAFNVQLGWPLLASALATTVSTALIFLLLDFIVFRPMRKSADIALLIVSIALTFVLENIVRLVFGSDVRGLDIPLQRPTTFLGVRAAPDDLYLIATAAVVVITIHLLLRFSPLGKAMRAIADNESLAAVRGINTAAVTTATCLICGAVLGVSGVMSAVDLVIEPLLGWQLIIPIFAAAILGGIGSPYGAVLGALAVGLAEELTILVLPSTYKTAVAFLIIAIVLLTKPHGILGRPEIRK